MKHIGRDAEGWYYIPAMGQPNRYMRTPLCPVDSTNFETWATTALQAVEDATNRGFGETCLGEPYDLDNFLADRLVGDLPWNTEQAHAVFHQMIKDPRYEQIMQAFYDKYGKEFLPRTIEGMHKLIRDEDSYNQ